MDVPASVICAEDVAHWPYTTGLMVKWVSFLGSVHWPAGGLDLGVGGVYVELFNLYELWAGEMLSFEKAVPRCLRPGRPISVSAVPFGPSIDIWRSCRLIGAMMTSLCFLPGGLGRFVPCSIGANHCRLRHIWWEKCGHGLASRPRESSSELFLNEVLGLFRYPPGSGRAFACRTTTRRLPVSGHVVDLVAANVGAAQEVIADGACQEVYWVSSSGPGRKRTRLNRKNPAHLAGFMVQSRPRVWKRLRHVGHSSFFSVHKTRRSDQDNGGVDSLGFRAGPRLQVRTFQLASSSVHA